jgi:serine/threonine protein kinase
MSRQLVPPFRIEGQFVGGGLGQLLKCVDGADLQFAGKLPKDASPESQSLIDDEFRRLLRHQSRHVVELYGPIQHSDGRRGFAMELMEGSLADIVAQRGALDVRDALNFFRQLALGLADIHGSATGAHHGDIKTANVLFRNSTAKLSDFGLARGGEGQTTIVGGHQWGTRGYMPPEGYTSPAGDVYSAGVTLWAMLVGREPDPIRGPWVITLKRPAAVVAMLDRMLSTDPTRRPSVQSVVDDCSRLLRTLDQYRRRERDALLGIGAAAVAVLAVFGLFKK